MKALGKYMQPNQAILTVSRRMKSWMVRGLFASHGNEKNMSSHKCWTLRNASCPIKLYL